MNSELGTFTLRRGDNSYGPYTAAEVAAYLAAGNIAATDALFDHDAQAWTTAGALVPGASVPVAAPATLSDSAVAPKPPLPPGTAPLPPLAPPTVPAFLAAASTAPHTGSDGLAIATLVLGALSIAACGFFTGVAAIVLGSRTYPNPSDANLARIGLVLGIIGTAISLLGTCAWIGMMAFSF